MELYVASLRSRLDWYLRVCERVCVGACACVRVRVRVRNRLVSVCVWVCVGEAAMANGLVICVRVELCVACPRSRLGCWLRSGGKVGGQRR